MQNDREIFRGSAKSANFEGNRVNCYTALIVKNRLLNIILMMLYAMAVQAQGYRLINVEKVSVNKIGFQDDNLDSIVSKMGKPVSWIKEFDEEVGIYRITYQYDSLSIELSEVKKKTFLDYIEILSPRYQLVIEDKSVRIGDKLSKLEFLFPLAYDNYEKNQIPDKKGTFKVYMKYDTGSEWVFYGKIVFKLNRDVITSIYLVYSAEF